MKIAVAGSKTISVKCLEWLVQQGEEIVSVFVNKDSKAALDWQESLKKKALAYNLNVCEENINKHVDFLKQQNIDALFSIQYGPLLKKEILNIPRLGCINLHNGDLPRYGGCGPVYHAMLNGEEQMAVTLHYMDENFDTGNIIAKKKVKIEENENSEELFEKVTLAGFELFKEQYYLIEENKNSRTPQTGNKLYYGMHVFDFGDPNQRLIQWDEDAKNIHNKIRTFTFPKRNWKASTYLQGEKIEISESKLENRDMKIKKYGQITDISSGKMFVAARDGIVSIGKINNVNAEKYCNDNKIEKNYYLG